MHFLKQQDIYFHFGMLAFKAISYYNKFYTYKVVFTTKRGGASKEKLLCLLQNL